MKRHLIQWILVPAMCCMGSLVLSACDDDDGNGQAPADIGGAWTSRIIGSDVNGRPFDYQGTMTIEQDGQAVTGSYSYYNGNTFRFSGTYVDGILTAVDSDDWDIRIEFEDDVAAGTLSGLKESGQPSVETITLARQAPAT